MGKSLPIKDRVKVLLSLVQNFDVFALSPYKVPQGRLGVYNAYVKRGHLVSPKKQKSRRSTKPHMEAVKEEMEKLKQVGAIKEVFFPNMLANTVVIKKKNGKWRVCIDFTDLNRACTKDPFTALKIDQLVDATYGHPRMTFLNTFQGYH